MKRLTHETSLSFCDLAQCREMPCPYDGACDQRKIYEKLREYERSGMTPQEVAQIAEINIPKRLTKAVNYLLDRYDEALEKGKLIRNPVAWAFYQTWKEFDG